jgi:predicted enzyme related to lactoylglutathione lyase
MPASPMGPARMGFLIYDRQKNGIGAAIVQGPGYEPTNKGTKVYLNGGSDLNNILNKVENAGGKIILAKTLITPELGYFATFQDTEGNHISLHSMN